MRLPQCRPALYVTTSRGKLQTSYTARYNVAGVRQHNFHSIITFCTNTHSLHAMYNPCIYNLEQHRHYRSHFFVMGPEGKSCTSHIRVHVSHSGVVKAELSAVVSCQW